MIETGIELLDVFIKTLVTYPVESFVFLCLVVFAYKFFGNREIRHEMWWDFKHWFTIDIRYFLPRLINNKSYSYCGIEVDMIDKVFMIIKTRYAFWWRQREIIKDETGLKNEQITQIIDALINLNKIVWDDQHRLVVSQKIILSVSSK